MAFQDFYIDPSGDSMSAGSVAESSPSVTQTNGSWDITADTFIAAAGTPFSGISAGEWASIYNDGATAGAVYVAQILTVNLAGLSITLSTTTKYGAKPASGATGKSCKVGGSWLDETPLVTLTGSVPGPTKINIKAATYTLAGDTLVQLAGLADEPLWFSGYNTTPGDLDDDTTNALSKPIFATSSFYFWSYGANHLWSSLEFNGSRAGPVVIMSGNPTSYGLRLSIENTSSSSSAVACDFQPAVAGTMAYCWFRCPTPTNSAACIKLSTGTTTLIGCVAEGSATPGFYVVSGTARALQCVSLNNSIGFLITSVACQIINSTIYNTASDGITWTGTIPADTIIVGCLFVLCGTYGIHNSAGTNGTKIFRACNDFYACTAGPENGFPLAPAFFGQTESSNPVTSSTDMTPIVGSNAISNGFPGIFENQSYSSFLDIGAVEAAGSTSSGGFVPQVFE